MLEKTSEPMTKAKTADYLRRSSQPSGLAQPTPRSLSAAPLSAVQARSEAQASNDRGAGDQRLIETRTLRVAGQPTSERHFHAETQADHALAEASANAAVKTTREAQRPQPKRRRHGFTDHHRKGAPARAPATESSKPTRDTPEPTNPRKRRRQNGPETHGMSAPARDDGAQLPAETQGSDSPIVASIRKLWPIRQAWHRAEKRLILAGKAKCRIYTEGDKEKASALFDAIAKGKRSEPEVWFMLRPFLAAIEPLANERAALELRLLKLVRELPVYAWSKSVKGFGELNLAGLVGEAGDIGSYRNPSCFWKRMGLAVIAGERQRKVGDADAALIHGYSPSRRSVAYQLGETLAFHQLQAAAKSGTEYGKPVGPYGQVYVARRERTAVTHPDWTKKHAANDARRVMTKAALRDLWIEWRRLSGDLAPAPTPAPAKSAASRPRRSRPATPKSGRAGG